MDDEIRQLIQMVVAAQKDLFTALSELGTADWLHLELSMGQLKGLFAIAQRGPIGLGGVAELLGITLSAASILVDKLVREDLVERREDRADRRRTIIQLTGKGEQMVSHLRQGGQERFYGLLQQLEPQDLKALAQGLKALAAQASVAARSNRSA